MIAVLLLEAIGDNHNVLARSLRGMDMPIRSPWVARITGRDAKYGYAREFVRARKDYAGGNSIGSRGVMLHFVLNDGEVYEVRQLTSWTSERRYFARAILGKVVEVPADEVEFFLDRRPDGAHGSQG